MMGRQGLPRPALLHVLLLLEARDRLGWDLCLARALWVGGEGGGGSIGADKLRACVTA